ncbi:MAG: DUF3159 domain-containing protein [Bacillota bacterium]
MKITIREIIEELKEVVFRKTFDTILPPLIFIIINGLFGLNTAVIVALSLALILGIRRLLKKQAWHYALGGFLGVSLASALAYLTQSAASYFIPAIITSIILLTSTLISLGMGKPLAAWASHITRGWPLDWFWRDDVKPAYSEVTIFWSVFFAARLSIQILLFRTGNAAGLAWANTLLGWPVTIAVLIASYIYGIWRLRNLGGPGVEEYQEGKKPPWEGQKRGF